MKKLIKLSSLLFSLPLVLTYFPIIKTNDSSTKIPGESTIFTEDNNSPSKIPIIHHTTFNMEEYFQNLYTYSPSNELGTCGYVSLIQALSYYDTFHNDNIIPDKYDRGYYGATNIYDAKKDSPGVLRNSYKNSGFTNYYEFCHGTMDYDFQSYLSVINNQLRGSDNTNNFFHMIGGYNYQKLLRKFLPSVTVDLYENKTQSQFDKIIKSIIDNNEPAVVHIEGNGRRHSVVAYSYDSSNIYANYGHQDYETKLPLFSKGYEKVYLVARLDFSSFNHYHSNNYCINHYYYCGCNNYK